MQPSKVKTGTDVFHAIADPTRRSLLQMLAVREMPIAALTEKFPLSRTAVNKHLHVLTDAGLVSSKKVGRETRYKLQPEPLIELQKWLDFFESYWTEKLSALQQFVENDDDVESW